jgi:hypothetical protein
VAACEVAIGKVGGTNRGRPRGPLKVAAPLLKWMAKRTLRQAFANLKVVLER